jgi:hypothetical protein
MRDKEEWREGIDRLQMRDKEEWREGIDRLEQSREGDN